MIHRSYGEALSCGTPIVTTSIGAEGYKARHRKTMWIAKNAKDFAAGIKRVYADKKLWLKLSKNGKKLSQKYEPRQVHRLMDKAIEKLIHAQK